MRNSRLSPIVRRQSRTAVCYNYSKLCCGVIVGSHPSWQLIVPDAVMACSYEIKTASMKGVGHTSKQHAIGTRKICDHITLLECENKWLRLRIFLAETCKSRD